MDYESRYLKEGFYWGLKPHPLVVDAVQYLPPRAKVLDLGCGEGKNAFFLARHDFDVTAIDISEAGIQKLGEFAQKEQLNIRADVSDAVAYLQDCDSFDAIFAIAVFPFIDEHGITKTIELMQAKTGVGGLNIIVSFVAETQEDRDTALSNGRYLFNEGELKDLYKNWNMLFYEEKLGDWETHGEPLHRHFVVKMIARKDGTAHGP